MKDDGRFELFICVAVFLFGIMIGALIQSSSNTSYIKTEAIEKGFAEYNSKTAEFQWKEIVDLKERTLK